MWIVSSGRIRKSDVERPIWFDVDRPSDVKRQDQSNAKRDLTWHSGWLLRDKVRPRGLPRFPTKILNTM